jgi:hypothetical protein
MELSKYLRDFSRTIAGKEQLMISAMAKALEIIPRQLCDNAGFDATNILNKLRQSHAEGKLVMYSIQHFVLFLFFLPIQLQMWKNCVKEMGNLLPVHQLANDLK